jgi:DNA (cytosine-5)-methyltransferase 1
VRGDTSAALRSAAGTASPPTVLSTFSGLGGFDLGLEAAGFSCVGCIEWDEHARRSLELNRSTEWRLLEPGDIALIAPNLSPEDVGLRSRELTLLAGGLPCQPFSKAAQWSRSSRIGLRDPRASYIRDYLSLLARFLPEAGIIENVAGFVTGETSALNYIRSTLGTIARRTGVNYHLEARVCQASHFGVPQRRTRAIVILLRDRSRFMWPAPRYAARPVTAWDAIGGRSPMGVALPALTGRWAALLPSIPEGRNYLWHTPRGEGEPLFGYRSRYWSFLLKLARDEPAWTLSASPGPATGPFHWHNRPLAVWEMLRLQTFPAAWAVDGPYREQVRQIGNATPPLLGEVLGRAILRTIGRSVPPQLQLRLRRRQGPPDPSPPIAVPREFLALRGPHGDHPGAGRGPDPRQRRQRS